ncbi:MAG: hypothetical protein FWB72_02415 [Firmicutes bacterium]|nr:hypothetical protein [Bacillota bacterium]
MLKILKQRRNMIISAVALVAVVVSVVFIITACRRDPLRSVLRHVSEIQYSVWTGSNTDYTVSVVTGRRETPFNIDGRSTATMTDFTVITMTPTNRPEAEQTFTFTLTVANNNFNGTFVTNPFGDNFFADLSQMLGQHASIAIRIVMGEDTQNITLQQQNTSEMITGYEVLEIAQREFSQLFENINFEILIKFVQDPLGAKDTFFWYIALVNAENQFNALLINPITREIVARKTT